MKYDRTLIAQDIGYTSIIDEKFKTTSLYVRFITRLDPKTAAANSLGIGTLSSSCASLTTLAELNEKLSVLYGAALSTFTRKRGDVQILGLSSSWISSDYALDGDDVDGEMLGVVRDCLFAPNAQNGRFSDESFRITRKDLLDRIDAELNNKRGYALARASEIAFRGEPAENSCYGTKDSAAAVTSEEAYSAYRSILETAQVEIYYISAKPDPAACEMFRKGFAGIVRRPQTVEFLSKSPAKAVPETVTDVLDVRQCKMVMTFKSDSDDYFALRLLSTILGETPVSKLFLNVREKLSLCYYCASRFTGSKNTLMIDSGVERSNIEKAQTEILAQLDEIRRGNVSDSELESALLAIDNALEAVGDTPGSYSSWFFERFCDGEIVAPADRARDFRAVTRERLVRAAASLKPDSTYFMLDKEADN